MNSKDILKSVHEHVIKSTGDIAELKTDMKEHMRRTAIVETKVSWLERMFWTATGGAGVIYFLVKFFLN